MNFNEQRGDVMIKTRYGWVAILVILILLALGYRTPKYFTPGVYVLSERRNTTPIEGIPVYYQEDTIYSVAPAEIKVDLNLADAKKVVYGSFELGNVQQKVFYLATINKKDDIEALYVDRNRDGVLNSRDRVLLYVHNDYKDGTRERTTNEPLRILVDYRTASNVIVHKYISFKIMVLWHPKSQIARTAHWVTSWFTGELKFSDDKRELPVKVAVIDRDSNGIFNDFNNKDRDVLVADINYNGKFEKNEIVDFSNLFEIKDKNRKTIQYRNYLFPWPYRLAILPVSDWKNSAAFEPSSDGDPPLLPKQPAATEKTSSK
jgi:hypothetical protein